MRHCYSKSLGAAYHMIVLFIATLATVMTLFLLETYPRNRARRTNGATQTFRRPSHATSLSGSTNHSSSRDAAAPQNSSTNSGVYVPPHAQPGRNGSSFEGRYSRDQLTQLFRIQQSSSDLNDGLSDLYMGGWEPHATNGASSASWGRKDDHGREREAPSGVDQCWDRDGSILPLSLTDMTDDEKEVGTHTPPHLPTIH
jgi:PERQ amino acid-rich with GYF domain-containing protein